MQITKMHETTPSQIPRAGYEYQDLASIEFLIEFYIDPKKYDWIKLEATEQEYNSIDDIVAKIRGKNKYTCVQVKFRVEPEREDLKLSFKWLLEKRKNGKSLLEKWANKIIDIVNKGELEEACLKTNAIPDDEVRQALNAQGKIDFDKIPEVHKKSMIEQLRDENYAKIFCDNFTFEHSLATDMENQIKSKLFPHFIDGKYFLEFKETIKEWVMKKNIPEPDGRITYKHIKDVINAYTKGNLIPQNFPMPKEYTLADEKFHDEMLRLSEKPGVIVVSGKPGVGKSTYLTYLGDHIMKEKKIPVIRHHYFLSLSDQSSERYQYTTIEDSLLYQLEKNSDKEFQKNDINHAIIEYAKENKLIIIIDGLDHVWRENKSSGLDQLEALFNRILPLPGNVTLIIGTQNVSDEYLPIKLLQESPKKQWNKMPHMNLEAIESWLEKASSNNSLFNVPRKVKEKKIYFSEIAKAFHEISDGLPIHLFYSLNTFYTNNVIITAQAVANLSICPEGDIQKYYEGLWSSLSPTSKEILHMLAATNFNWPQEGILSCLNIDSADMQSYDNISHMLQNKDSGITPFHSSIIAFIHEKPEHKDAVKRLLPRAIKWLDEEAPIYLKEFWLWLTKAQAGDESSLIENPSREWVVESILKGYPISQIVLILRKAEKIAFDQKYYCRFQEIRHLKFRLENAPDFGMYGYTDFDELQEYIGLFAKDEKLFEWMFDNLPLIDDGSLVVISNIYKDYRCIEEINHRNELHLMGKENYINVDNKYAKLIHAILPSVDNVPPEELVEYSKQFSDDHYDFFQSYIKKLMLQRESEKIIDYLNIDMPNGIAIELARVVMRVCYLEKIDLCKRIEPQHINKFPLLRCWATIVDSKKLKDMPGCIEHPINDYRYDNGKSAIYEHFFECLNIALNNNNKKPSTLSKIPDRGFEWVESILPEVENIAKITAKRFNSHSKNFLDFGFLFSLLEEIEHPMRPESDIKSFKHAIMEISFDLHYLFSKAYGIENNQIDIKKIEECKKFKFYSTGIFFDTMAKTKLRIIKDTQVNELCNQRINSNKNAINEIAERIDNYAETLRLCILYDIDDLAKNALRSIVSLAIGYYQRKDYQIYEVLNSIEKCLKNKTNKDKIINWLEKIEPMVLEIQNMTEKVGYATDEYFDILAKVMPERLLEIRNKYLEEEEWSYADKALASFIKNADLGNQPVKLLCGSITFGEPAKVVKKLASENNKNAKEILNEIEINIGIQEELQGEEYVDSSQKNVSEEENIILEYSDYPPEEVENFILYIDKLSYSASKEVIIKEWIDFWDNQGKGMKVLEYMKVARDKDIRELHNFDRTWGYFFELSIILEGEKEAYDWIVWDHIRTIGWDSNWSGEEKIIKRFEIFSQRYKDKWQEFIFDAAKPRYRQYDKNIAFGQSMAVLFFFSVEQNKLAEDMTDTLINLLISDFENFSFKESLFDAKLDLSLCVFKSFLAQLRLPFPYMQIIAIKKIVKFIDEEVGEEFKNEFLNWLSARTLESEVIPGLIIVSLSKDKNMIGPEELRKNINKPSRLSDIYIEEIYKIHTIFNIWSTCHSGEYPSDFIPSAEFEQQHQMFRPVIFSHIKEMTDATGFNFLLQWAWEFYKIRSEKKIKKDIRYFIDHRSRPVGIFDDELCNIFTSAYLRTLSFSLSLGVPEHAIDNLCYIGFDFKLARIESVQKSDFLCGLEDKIVKLNDTSKILSDIVGNCSFDNSSDFYLAHASFPISREDLRKTDIEISSAIVQEGISMSVASEHFFGNYIDKGMEYNGSMLSEYEISQNDVSELPDSLFSPIAFKIRLINYAHWHNEQMMRGVYTLNPIIFKNASREYTDDAIVFKVDNRTVGKWLFWVDKWEPAHPKGVHAGIGTALFIEKDFIKEYTAGTEYSMMSAMRITNLIRDDDYKEFEKTEEYFGPVSFQKN